LGGEGRFVVYVVNPFGYRRTSLFDLCYLCAKAIVESGVDARRVVVRVLPVGVITNGGYPMGLKQVAGDLYDSIRGDGGSLCYSPVYTLANPAIGLPLYSFGGGGDGRMVMEPDRVLHVAYAVVHGWICACICDCVGDVFKVVLYEEREGFVRLWRDVVREAGYGGFQWRIVFCKAGAFARGEVEGMCEVL
jgi:hypothetical protein